MAGDTILSADINKIADGVNKLERLVRLSGAKQVFDLVNKYGVATTNSASANTTAIQLAFADAALVGGVVYLQYAPDIYPVNTLTLPAAPISLVGDGPTSSILGTTAGKILTYNPALPIADGATTPFSRVFGSAGGKGVAYQSNTWRIHGMGFANTDAGYVSSDNALYFPKWTAGSAPQQLVLWMSDCIVSNFAGLSDTHAAIWYEISGGVTDSHFVNVTVSGASGSGGRGFYTGSDSRLVNCTSHSNGNEGFYCNSYIWQAIGLKGWDNGKRHVAGLMSGLFIQGYAPGHFTNCYLQDNNGPGVTLKNCYGTTIKGLTVDRNCWNEEASGFLITGDCQNVEIDGLLGFESNDLANKTRPQAHTLHVVTGGSRFANRIRLVDYRFFGITRTDIGPAIDATSDLTGISVTVGGSDGGQVTLTPTAGTVHPDPYNAFDQIVPMAASISVVGTAYNMHPGCRMRITFMPSGGAFSINSWNASYRGTSAIPTTAGASGQYMVTEWEAIHPASGGTAWYLQNTPAWRT